MEVIKVTEQEKDTYNQFVTANGGSFLQSYEWGEWQKANGRPATQYLVVDEGNHIASAQLIRHPLPLGQFYLYCPYGPVLRTNANNSKALETLFDTVRAEYSQALFVKIESQSDLANFLTLTPHTKATRLQPGSTLILNLDESEEQLLEQMHKKTRYDIRIAAKHAVQVIEITEKASSDMTAALALLAETEERQNYKGHNLTYYRNLIENISTTGANKPILRVYAAKHADRILSSGIFIDFAGTRTYLFGGSAAEHREVMPAYALHWQLIQGAKKQGLKHYDFWGIETSSGTTPGFVRFKLGFGGQQVHYPPAVDIPVQKILYSVYRIAKKLFR